MRGELEDDLPARLGMLTDENPKKGEKFLNGIKCRTLWKMAPKGELGENCIKL